MSEIERCPTCGSSVRLEGTITRYFMPVENEHIADLESQLAAMKPMLDACKARYERHNQEHYKISGLAPCYCLTCQWYRDYEARKPK